MPSLKQSINFSESPESSKNIKRLKSINWTPRKLNIISTPKSIDIDKRKFSRKRTIPIGTLTEILNLSINDLNHYSTSNDLNVNATSLKAFWSIKYTSGDKPNSCEYSQLLLANHQLYLCEGHNNKDFSDVKSLDLITWKWNSINTSKYIKGIIGQTVLPYKNKLFLYGGYSVNTSSEREYITKVHCYSIKRKKWYKLKSLGIAPFTRRYHSACKIEKFMIIYGGILSNSKVSSDLLCFNMKNKYWEKIDSQNTPGPRSYSSLTAIFLNPKVNLNNCGSISEMIKYSILKNSGFYLYGGKDQVGKCSSDIFYLSINNDIFMWTKIDAKGRTPPSRYSHAAININQRIFIFGGRSNNGGLNIGDYALGDLCVFNVINSTWESFDIKGNIPESRWGHSMSAYGTKIYLFGGITHKKFMDNSLYCLETDEETIMSFENEDQLEENDKGEEGYFKRSESIVKKSRLM